MTKLIPGLPGSRLLIFAVSAVASVMAFQPSHSYRRPVMRIPQQTLSQDSCCCRRRMAVEVLNEMDMDNSLSLLSQLDTFWQTFPYTTAAVVCGVKASAADLIAQQSAKPAPPPQQPQDKPLTALLHSNSGSSGATVAAPHASDASFASVVSSSWQEWVDATTSIGNRIDGKRNLAFLLYGSLYQGMVHEYVFNTLYPEWFGDGTNLEIVAIKVVFNLLVQTTFVTLPVAYILKSYICDASASENNNNAIISNSSSSDKASSIQRQQHEAQSTTAIMTAPLETAMEKYWNDIQHEGLLWKAFAIWGPVQCLTFSVVPEHYRVTFIAIVSFFWLILLSSISSSSSSSSSKTS